MKIFPKLNDSKELQQVKYDKSKNYQIQTVPMERNEKEYKIARAVQRVPNRSNRDRNRNT